MPKIRFIPDFSEPDRFGPNFVHCHQLFIARILSCSVPMCCEFCPWNWQSKNEWKFGNIFPHLRVLVMLVFVKFSTFIGLWIEMAVKVIGLKMLSELLCLCYFNAKRILSFGSMLPNIQNYPCNVMNCNELFLHVIYMLP